MIQNESNLLKITAGIIAVITVAALVLVSFRVIEWTIFWVIIIFAAFAAYMVIPYLRGHYGM